MQLQLLTVAEAAAVLKVGRTRIYLMLARGELPRVYLGRSVRVPAAALGRWVEERTAQPPEAR